VRPGLDSGQVRGARASAAGMLPSSAGAKLPLRELSRHAAPQTKVDIDHALTFRAFVHQ
jgi:hypothetical protein